MPELILVTGGARSGKSKFATELALNFSSPVTFIATAPYYEDLEMKERIDLHRKSRPSHWQTIEEQEDVASILLKINSPQKVVIVDCLTLLISNLLLKKRGEKKILAQVEAIANAGRKFNKATIIVSNEVGWGVVPPTKLGRKFRDIAGMANQIVARESNQVWLLVCGIPCRLKDNDLQQEK
ncbi:bifunctional adenosylcobinamide kinase/adenosylcobinamide-phosphate guanylyltransferase [Candidatus Aerophobetes bacterium]|nr:bifunctional adenosylcobinamide kinase/adenosylcobinamide-phosphate guanylyltransferase [Candidatus Aerophobetes bacterium]